MASPRQQTEPRTQCKTPTPGKRPTSIPTWKYQAVRAAILDVVPTQAPGVAAKALPELVSERLDADVLAKLGSLTWHTTTVKLNMEVIGELRRLPKIKPQRLVRTTATHTHAPPGWPEVVPRLAADDARGLVEFIKAVFDAVGDYQTERPTELRIGSSLIMVGNTLERHPVQAFLYVYVADVNAAHNKALALGAESIEAPAEMPYGDRRAMLVDPWGNHWQIATHRGFAPE